MRVLLICIVTLIILSTMSCLICFKVEGFETRPPEQNQELIQTGRQALQDWKLCLQASNLGTKKTACNNAVDKIENLTRKTSNWPNANAPADLTAQILNAAYTIQFLKGGSGSVNNGMLSICVPDSGEVLSDGNKSNGMLDICTYDNGGAVTNASTASDSTASDSASASTPNASSASTASDTASAPTPNASTTASETASASTTGPPNAG